MEIVNIAHKLDEKERTSDIKLSEKVPFRKMMLSEHVRRGLSSAGFVYPTVLQLNAIPLGKAEIDLVIQSKSGTGKTLIFCTIILDAYDCSINAPQSLILVPTREVAVQIESILSQVGKFLPNFNAVSVIGGTNFQVDRKRLQSARAIVGTPGRVLHLIKFSVLNTEFIKLFVIDEADKFLDPSFRETFEEINLSLVNKKQTIACSATVKGLDVKLTKYMKNPLLLSAEKGTAVLFGIKQFVLTMPEAKTNIMDMTSKISALKQIFSKVSFKQCIVFVNSQSRAESYSNFLEKDGWPCECISGAQDQSKRLEKFRRFRDFKTRILISTDLMSRGIDSERLNLVINLEIPDDASTYLHRIGRAGRFGTHGIAISFVASRKDRSKFKNILSYIGPQMVILKYPEKGTFDLYDFSNQELEEKEYGIFNPYDSDTDKENYPCEREFKNISTEIPCPNIDKITKVPLNQNKIGNTSCTISNSSQKVHSNSAITLDDASSLTIDSDTLQNKKVLLENMGKSPVKFCNNHIMKLEPKILKLSPIELVLDPDTKASSIGADLFEDYDKMAVSSEVESTHQEVPPNTLHSDKIKIRLSEMIKPKIFEAISLNNNINKKGIFELSKENEVRLDTRDGKFNSLHEPGPSCSFVMDQSTLNFSKSSNEQIKSANKNLEKSSDSETEDIIKHSNLKATQGNVTHSRDSNYNDSIESAVSASESVRSSGFEEKFSTSSGIVTSSTENSDSTSGSYYTYNSKSTSSDGSSATSNKESSDSYDCESSDKEEVNLEDGAYNSTNKNFKYKSAQNLWNNIYWQQINQIHDYINASKSMRRTPFRLFQ